MKLYRDGNIGAFRCLGKKGVRYPKDLTINPALPNVKRHPYFSQEYVCDYPGIGQIGVPCRMNYSILIWGQRGIYIHEWPGRATYVGNGGSTAGCIHVEVGDAKKIYDWVDSKTRIVISYPW
ncbi:L,D-transpeptidase family protein [Aliikangiella maris]|uniref:L,D-transpeptidase n=2 Tax=Aliikangiella maris TaxID=3162458 RepID=A0ABV2BYN0_9GAMM